MKAFNSKAFFGFLLSNSACIQNEAVSFNYGNLSKPIYLIFPFIGINIIC